MHLVNMKICGYCGIEYHDSRADCLRCGNRLRNVDPKGPIEIGSGGSTGKHATYRDW
ncbi:MAG: hypothetical protein HYT71_03970 [Candidatus Aenigmarchaeota archaeon]|nr:hypothetical protein [Candidatus Aenigmarchaeota archaeon]